MNIEVLLTFQSDSSLKLKLKHHYRWPSLTLSSCTVQSTILSHTSFSPLLIITPPFSFFFLLLSSILFSSLLLSLLLLFSSLFFFLFSSTYFTSLLLFPLFFFFLFLPSLLLIFKESGLEKVFLPKLSLWYSADFGRDMKSRVAKLLLISQKDGRSSAVLTELLGRYEEKDREVTEMGT